MAWLRKDLANAPATHVLIVGVGQFAARTLEPLKSTPASAKVLAEWFLDGARGSGDGFANTAARWAALRFCFRSTKTARCPGSKKALYQEPHSPTLKARCMPGQTAPGQTIIQQQFSPSCLMAKPNAAEPRCFSERRPKLMPYAGMTEAEQLIDALSSLPPATSL